jgi:hypothetical protein
MARSLWASLKPLAEDVEIYHLAKVIETGGYRRDIFETESHTQPMVIRPWQQDQFSVQDEGAMGETPGLKGYAGLEEDRTNRYRDCVRPPRRGDRVHYEGSAWRITNPQVSTKEGIVRFDLRTDEREFTTVDEIDLNREDVRVVDSGRHQFDTY